MTFRVSLSPTEAASRIENYVISSAISAECVGKCVQRSADGQEAIMLVFEKYFMRNSSRASLSVLIENLSGMTYVASVGSGGGQNTLFSFDWGAGDDFAALPRKALGGFML